MVMLVSFPRVVSVPRCTRCWCTVSRDCPCWSYNYHDIAHYHTGGVVKQEISTSRKENKVPQFPILEDTKGDIDEIKFPISFQEKYPILNTDSWQS